MNKIGILFLLIFLISISYFSYDYISSNLISKKISCNVQVNLPIIESVFNEHKDVITQLESENVFFLIESENCEEKGNVLILYGTVFDQKRIKNTLGDSFFGIPYRMQNI